MSSLWRTADPAASDADQTLSEADQTGSDSDRPYDPIVRWGGDEFVCAVSGVVPAEARADAAQCGAKEEKRG